MINGEWFLFYAASFSVCCAEAIQLALSCLSGGIALHIGVQQYILGKE